MNTIKTKICRKCGKVKPKEDFKKHGHLRGHWSYNPTCIECMGPSKRRQLMQSEAMPVQPMGIPPFCPSEIERYTLAAPYRAVRVIDAPDNNTLRNMA